MINEASEALGGWKVLRSVRGIWIARSLELAGIVGMLGILLYRPPPPPRVQASIALLGARESAPGLWKGQDQIGRASPRPGDRLRLAIDCDRGLTPQVWLEEARGRQKILKPVLINDHRSELPGPGRQWVVGTGEATLRVAVCAAGFLPSVSVPGQGVLLAPGQNEEGDAQQAGAPLEGPGYVARLPDGRRVELPWRSIEGRGCAELRLPLSTAHEVPRS